MSVSSRSPSARYAVAGVAAVGVSVLALWPLLDSAGRGAVLVAAAVALPIQVAAFAALVRYRGRSKGFLAVWAGGTLVRMTAVLVVGWVVLQSGADGAVVLPLALAGFFFGLLLLEPVYFRLGQNQTR